MIGCYSCRGGMFVKMNLFENRTIDGHAPYLPNKELSAYKMAGVDTDHEATTFEYALEVQGTACPHP